MDTSIRLKRIQDAFGTSPVRMGEMTPKQAEVMALEVFAACASQLAYLNGFEPFAEYAFERRADDNGMARRITDVWSVTYDLPKPYEADVLVVPIRHTTFRRLTPQKSHPDLKRVYRQELLLARDGDILIWDWFARVQRDRGTVEAAIRSKVRIANGRMVKKIFNNPFNAQAFLAKVGWLVTDTIEEREKRLVSMKGLNAFIKAVEGQLTVH
jgi:hypothetical protein